MEHVPWLGYRIMNPRLLDLTRRDPNRINFHPARRGRLMQRYGLAQTS